MAKFQGGILQLNSPPCHLNRSRESAQQNYSTRSRGLDANAAELGVSRYGSSSVALEESPLTYDSVMKPSQHVATVYASS